MCSGSQLRLPSERSTYLGTNSVHFKACCVWNRLTSSLEKRKSLSEFCKEFKTISNIDCSRAIW